MSLFYLLFVCFSADNSLKSLFLKQNSKFKDETKRMKQKFKKKQRFFCRSSRLDSKLILIHNLHLCDLVSINKNNNTYPFKFSLNVDEHETKLKDINNVQPLKY